MELFDAIKQRYSHKGTMNPDVVPTDDDLRRMVEAGMAAPSAMNKQSPEFIIITERPILERIGWITGNATLASAPAMIAVLSYPGVGEDFTGRTMPPPPRTSFWRRRPSATASAGSTASSGMTACACPSARSWAFLTTGC